MEQSYCHRGIDSLRPPLTSLIGREQELKDICARLERPEVRLLTLLGMPGVGKTRLAIALAVQLQAMFAWGVYFVSLAAIRDSEQVLPAIAHAFGLPADASISVLEQLKLYLRNQSLLLVLDTFEHVLPAAPQLVDLLTACPFVKLLVTSRAVLSVQGEYEFSVLPLALPDLGRSVSIEVLAQTPSVALFVERMEARIPGLTLTEQNVALIARICWQLEGVPLAIELAAARCKLLSLQELASLLDQGLEVWHEVLSGGKHDLPERQQSLVKAIDWSYQLLSPDEQALFRRLSIFGGEFSLEAVTAVALAPGRLSISLLDGCSSLLNQSLLQQREDADHVPRLFLFKMMRAYGLDQLVAADELEPCLKAYVDYYVAQAEQALNGAKQLRSWEDLERGYGRNSKPALPSANGIREKLTGREIEVLRLLAKGLSNNQIAQQLVLSPFTVNRHAQSIYGKLGVNSRCAATRCAIDYHLL